MPRPVGLHVPGQPGSVRAPGGRLPRSGPDPFSGRYDSGALLARDADHVAPRRHRPGPRADPRHTVGGGGVSASADVDRGKALAFSGVHNPSGSPGSSGSSGYRGDPLLGTGRTVLDEVRDHFANYVCTVDQSDLDLLALWAAHTYLVIETYTTPRLEINSPVPGSGKTTVLEHF